VGAVGRRIVDPQQRRDDFAHGVVQDQAVRPNSTNGSGRSMS
jgi:hypothetical protein